jgi:hypothetical protein
MINLPKVVKYAAVSTTIRPVTQTALVDVNKASIGERYLVVAFGNLSRKAPTRIIKMKLLTNSKAGLVFPL